MNEADSLCHRVAFLADGRVVALDTPQALKLGLGDAAPEVDIVLDDHSGLQLALGEAQDADRLRELLSSGRVRSMHTLEPTLADVFIDLAGRSLDEDPGAEDGDR